MIDSNREEFEKLPNILERLNQGGIYWDGEKYTPKPFMSSFLTTAIFLNGAWYSFQEQQKKLDCCREENKALLERLSQKDHLINLAKETIKSYEALTKQLKGNQDD